MKTNPEDLSNLSLVELFRMEVEAQSKVLTDGLLEVERKPGDAPTLKELMRAAHSLKGAARIVGRQSGVRVAHAMEECFVAAQKEKISVTQNLIDTLLRGVDIFDQIAGISEDDFPEWESSEREQIEAFLSSLAALAQAAAEPSPRAPSSAPGANAKAAPSVSAPQPEAASDALESAHAEKRSSHVPTDRALRVTAENLNRLMGLAGEAMVARRWLETFATDLARLKRLQQNLSDSLDSLGSSTADGRIGALRRWNEIRNGLADWQQALGDRLSDLEQHDRRFLSFSNRLYHEVLDCRMRPFADGIPGLHRMVRDVARMLGKQVRLEIAGETTLVDRDVLEKVKAPLDHLLRNSIDHGIEPPAVRAQSGKPEEGFVRLEACHSAGTLLITVTDDGRGVDVEAVRQAVVQKRLNTPEAASTMSSTELLEFLFLPGFTLKEAASEISGRGVGLDAVRAMTNEVAGRVRIFSQPGQGTRFQLELPLTLSVVRTMLVEIAGEPYALPLSQLNRALKLPWDQIDFAQGRQHFDFEGEAVGLVAAHQVLALEEPAVQGRSASVVVFGEAPNRYGLVVDEFLGERELVVQSLDARLGKVKNISAAALLPDGSPILILDIEDLKRSIENLASGKQLRQVECDTTAQTPAKRKRVLVVDDSLTVRELERKLLAGSGYVVDIAVDGMDGWNAVRTGMYDLVVTDIDMPRMDGIELLKLIRKDHRLKNLPVTIVSYKDRPEDRARGLEAGADHYLTKASFHDETLLRAVGDLIGSAGS